MPRPMQLCVMPRWAGQASDDWYPWLLDALRAHRVRVVPLLPDKDAPRIADCRAELLRHFSELDLTSTILIGHSVGCLAQLHALAALPPGSRAAGLLCVAGWWWVDEPWDALLPWMQTHVDVEAVKRSVTRVKVLLSDDDPFTSAHEKNAETWRQRLDADVTVLRGAKHFNADRAPAVLDALADWLA